jgi:hypothetical protein
LPEPTSKGKARYAQDERGLPWGGERNRPQPIPQQSQDYYASESVGSTMIFIAGSAVILGQPYAPPGRS